MQITEQQIFLAIFAIVLASFWVPCAWLVMRFLTPRELVDRYFREPHFNRGELFIMAHFPGSLLRTSIFMAACFQERYRRGRQFGDYLSLVPSWYSVASKILCIFLFVHLTLMLASIAGMVIWLL